MNERIKQLAGQANIHFSRVGILDGDPNGSARMVGYSKMEKFAELIVGECVSILRKPEYPMTHPEELTDYNRGWVNGRLLGIEHIAYRFGVEE